ncbi:MAG: HesA/MoeB/ThiF family protein [Psychrobacter sp.]|nr:HesA/MoeB/ThiF family protein [Psychrobacter sp.]
MSASVNNSSEKSLNEALPVRVGRHSTELTDDELLRYSRQILLSGWDIDAQLNLKNSGVVIVGAGGLGCPVSETLARAGVGHIHLIDDDMIEMSNLQRQTLFTADDVGQPKAQVAAQRLQLINEMIGISFEVARIQGDNAEKLCQLSADMTPNTTPDLLLDCTDNFAVRDLLNRLSVRYQVPLLSAAAIGMSGQLTLFEPAKSTGCYHCLFGQAINESRRNQSQESASFDEQSCANSGVLASTTAIMGALQANAALQYLGRGDNPLWQKLLLWDGLTMTQRLMRYRADAHCPICG